MSRRKKQKKEWLDKRSKKILLSLSKHKNKRVIKRRKNNTVSEIKILDFFKEKKFYKKTTVAKYVDLEPPQSFTMNNHIDETLEFLKEVVYVLTKKNTERIDIEFRNIKNISLSASLILDLFLMDAPRYIYDSKYQQYKW